MLLQLFYSLWNNHSICWNKAMPILFLGPDQPYYIADTQKKKKKIKVQPQC